MSAMPRITVVTPCFNAAGFLREALESVSGQGYPYTEHIVIDGGSTDGTVQVIRSFGKHVAAWRSEPDAGQYDALNKGFALSTGEVMCWLNADDMLLPRALFVVAEVFAQLPQVEWLTTLRPALWDASGYLAKVGATPGFCREAFLDGLYLPGTRAKGYWIQQESTVWRRSLWQRAGGRIPACGLAGDFALWAEFYRHAELHGLEYPVAGFRTIAGQRSEDLATYRAEALAALQGLREACAWSDRPVNRLRYGRLVGLPKVGNLIKARCSYRGKRISREDFRLSAAPWRVYEHDFLP